MIPIEDLREVSLEAERRGALTVWVIFDHPTDHPDHFVVRPQLAAREIMIWPKAWTFDTLDEARDALPPGLFMMPRQATDAPNIAESWI